MKFVNYKVRLNGDTITIPLSRPCKCQIGLVEISIAEIQSSTNDNAIDVKCEQIDSTFENPNRLLQRIAFSSIRPKQYYHTWTARFIQMKTVDSEDRFLTLKINRTSDNSQLVLGDKVRDNGVFLTLAFSNLDDPESWTTYI